MKKLIIAAVFAATITLSAVAPAFARVNCPHGRPNCPKNNSAMTCIDGNCGK